MKKTRTRSVAGEALASPAFATVQLPLPLLDVLADTCTAFFGLCLEAGQEVLVKMMEADRAQHRGPRARAAELRIRRRPRSVGRPHTGRHRGRRRDPRVPAHARSAAR